MDKCKEHLDSDSSNNSDPKEGLVALDRDPNLKTLGSDKIDANKTVEDRNRNITLLKSKGKCIVEGKQLSTSSTKDKANVVGLHVGPNGLINGLEIENSASLSHLWEHIPKTEIHQSLCKPSSSHNAKSCEGSSGQSLKDLSKLGNDIRTELGLENNDMGDATSSEQSSSPASCAIPDIDRISPNSETQSQGETKPDAECDTIERTQETDVEYVSYMSELQMPDIMRLIQKDLSEPYSIYTYRYFIHNWPKLCFLAMDGKECVGAIVCKLDIHRKVVKRGYIAMLAVDEKYRKRKIGSNLVLKAIRAMVADDADEVVLETEITNRPALRLYENLGFVRDKRLFRYYLNGVDALRLKLWLR